VEPEAGNYAVRLEKVSQWPNVLPVKAALGGKPGHVSVNDADLGWAAQTVRSNVGIRILTIEDCVALVAAGHPFIVKVDIEGFEEDLFDGAVDWIDKTSVIAIEPHDWMRPGQFTSRNFLRALSNREFEVFILGENLIFVR
jgi:FkbM family methyltransferase